MKIRIAVIIGAFVVVATVYAQPVIPMRPMPMPAQAQIIVQPAEADYIHRFSCEDKGTHFVCRNMLDPNRDVLKVYRNDPKQQDFYKAIEAKVASGEGYKILMDPATRQMAILKPKFDPLQVTVYAGDLGGVLKDASDIVGIVRSTLRDEPLIRRALPGVAATVEDLNAKITQAVKAADAVVGVPGNISKERERKLMLLALAKLRAEVAGIDPGLDRGIRQAKVLVPGLKALVATGAKDKQDLEDLEQFVKDLELARKAIRQAQIDIQTLINLHSD